MQHDSQLLSSLNCFFLIHRFAEAQKKANNFLYLNIVVQFSFSIEKCSPAKKHFILKQNIERLWLPRPLNIEHCFFPARNEFIEERRAAFRLVIQKSSSQFSDVFAFTLLLLAKFVLCWFSLCRIIKFLSSFIRAYLEVFVQKNSTLSFAVITKVMLII